MHTYIQIERELGQRQKERKTDRERERKTERDREREKEGRK